MRRFLRASQSIRFRLSLGLALVVFGVGTLFVGGLYAWQVNRLEEPTLAPRPIVIQDLTTGRQFETSFAVLSDDEIARVVAERIELNAYQRALSELRRSAFVGVVVLFGVSFGAGWLLSGWVLKPIDRMNRVARDITATDLSRRISLRGPTDELKGLADTFDQMLDRLQVAFDGQRRFVHETSHELRNPLAAAHTNLELALDEDDPEAMRRAVIAAHRSTSRMGALVDDLLERARSDTPELVRTEVDLGRILVETADEFRAVAAERDLVLDVKIASDPVVVEGDAAALQRAVSNLVANAVRLAPRHTTVELAVSVPGGGPPGHGGLQMAEIRVTDAGPGVAEADRERVFERFWRGEDTGAGSGLGLAIVRQVAERHGGSAVVHPAGQGSSFVIRLPRRVDDGARAGGTSPDGALDPTAPSRKLKA